MSWFRVKFVTVILPPGQVKSEMPRSSGEDGFTDATSNSWAKQVVTTTEIAPQASFIMPNRRSPAPESLSLTRICRVRFYFGDLRGVALAVKRNHKEPLAAIEIFENRVRENPVVHGVLGFAHVL